MLVLLKIWVNSQKTWSSGATECRVWIGNCNVKVWKSIEHKLHNICRSLKFQQNEHTPGATECRVWIGNCNVKVWKSTEHKLHNIWRSLEFLTKSGKRAHPCFRKKLLSWSNTSHPQTCSSTSRLALVSEAAHPQTCSSTCRLALVCNTSHPQTCSSTCGLALVSKLFHCSSTTCLQNTQKGPHNFNQRICIMGEPQKVTVPISYIVHRGVLVFLNLCKILVSARYCGVCAR